MVNVKSSKSYFSSETFSILPLPQNPSLTPSASDNAPDCPLIEILEAITGIGVQTQKTRSD